MNWQLSMRLHAISTYLLPDVTIADIGGDHGYLLINAAKRGVLKKGIIGEIGEGPFQAAEKHVKKYGLEEKIEVRLGDGLAVLQKEEAEIVVIAGMGGALISHILEEGKGKLGRIKRLILQPNIGEQRVRQWLRENHFQIMDEQIVQEQEIYYEIIVAEPSLQEQLDPTWDSIGPKLWEKRDPLFYPKRLTEQQQRQNIWKKLQAAKTQAAIVRRIEIEAEIKHWEKVLEEWRTKEES